MSSEAHRPSGTDVPTDALFEALSDDRRRRLLTVLRATDLPQAVADVARNIAVSERDAPLEAIPPEDLDRIYHSLYHAHVPKLECLGLITHDHERNTVALTERGERLLSDVPRAG